MTVAQMTALTGRVVHPGDPGYDAASAGWNGLHVRRPAAVVFAAETADVVNALAWARHRGLPVRARSGRHALEGWSAVDGGVVIDVSGLTSVTVDPESATATLGAGIDQLQAVTALGEAGFAAPTGTEGSVGLVGATLGGGFGLLSRPFGMACDHLLAAEIVLAPAAGGAEVVVVDERHHGDLLWALRGAGNGTFGVVTSMTMRIHPVTRTVRLVATWPGLGHFRSLFDAWQRHAPHGDDRLTSQLEVTAEEVTLTAVLVAGSEADPEGDMRALLDPMLRIGRPDVVVTDGDWGRTFAGFQIPLEEEPANWKFTSQFVVEPFPPRAIEMLAAALEEAPPGCNYFTNALGGAVATDEPTGGSAFAHRRALFYAEPGAGWGDRGGPPPEEERTAACLDWVRRLTEALAPYVDGAYVNVPNAGIQDWEAAYWGDNVARLRAVKAGYDPCRVFDAEHGITPGETEDRWLR
ncbi:FAD-binding oxidoreductase [Actinomycetospora atypica]|uniref:FAD-binding oxidoreductase n=1 Tax=Actinomycetospora atypica TaxID=1290095 RepID=A0ABV9YSN8_9PSEU